MVIIVFQLGVDQIAVLVSKEAINIFAYCFLLPVLALKLKNCIEQLGVFVVAFVCAVGKLTLCDVSIYQCIGLSLET